MGVKRLNKVLIVIVCFAIKISGVGMSLLRRIRLKYLVQLLFALVVIEVCFQLRKIYITIPDTRTNDKDFEIDDRDFEIDDR